MTTPDPALEHALGAAIFSDTDEESLDHLAMVSRAAEADQLVGQLLTQAVATARSAGHSWAAIGTELGMSRQAAQKRFGTHLDDADDDEAEYRWLGPVTAFDEMDELAIAGRQGWRTVDAGMFKHRVKRTDTQWEHKRVVWTPSMRKWERDGWEVAIRFFPWVYIVRDLGIPPETVDSVD